MIKLQTFMALRVACHEAYLSYAAVPTRLKRTAAVGTYYEALSWKENSKMGAPHRLGTSDIQISPIVMGMWQAGKEMWTGIDDTEIRRAVHAAVEAGINAFDTAEMYGKGHSERMLAAATADIRDKVVVMTKVFSNHLQYDQVIAACNRSLKNLNTDRIDLYQIHWPSGSWGSRPVAIEETMRALNDLKAQGKIRAIGVSNFSRAQLEEAAGFGRIDSFQPPYSLFWRHVEKDGHVLLPGQQRHDPRLFTHGPGNPDRQVRPAAPL